MSVVTNCRDLPGIQCPQDEDSAPLEYFGAVSILAIIGNFRRRAHGRANNCDESNHVDLGDHHYRKLWRRRGEQEYGPSLLTPDGRKCDPRRSDQGVLDLPADGTRVVLVLRGAL